MLRSPYARKALLVLAAVFFLLRFVHLTADYPRNIRWDDGIATDEGWYASAAVNQQLWDKPLLDGDMNIPVIMPVWSAIAETAFHIGGFSVVTLRVTAILFFLGCTGICCVLLHRYGAQEWIPLFLAMMAVNPWCFAFSRAAFLEFPMLCLVLLAAVLVPPPTGLGALSRWLQLIAAGLAFALAVLLKTTAVALAPLLMYAIWERSGFKIRAAIGGWVAAFGAAGILYGTYWMLAVRPHIIDVRFYLSVVKNTLRLTPYGFIADTSRPFRYGLGSDHLLFLLSIIVLAGTLLSRRLRGLWKDPLFGFAGVWLVSFLSFMVKHNNDPARYFAVTIPACLFVGIALLRNHTWSTAWMRKALVAAVAVDMAINAFQVSAALAHPLYTFHAATTQIAQLVRANDPRQSSVIGYQMHEVALHDGLRPINLLFHSDSITEQMNRYRPRWYLQFGPLDDGKCFREVIGRAYRAEFCKEWTVFYPGQKLVLWKLTEIPGARLPTHLTDEQTAACSPPVYN